MTWVVEFFRRRVNADFKGHSLGVDTHLMALLRSMRLFTKFFSDTTVSYEVVRGDSEFTEYCRGKEEREVPNRGDIITNIICYFLDLTCFRLAYLQTTVPYLFIEKF